MVTKGVWGAVVSCWEVDGGHLLSPAQQSQLSQVLRTAAPLVESLVFLPQVIIEQAIRQLQSLPLEVVTSLHTAGVMSLESFLEASVGAVQYLVAALVSLSCGECKSPEGRKVVVQALAEALCQLVDSHSPVAVQVVEQLPAALLAQPLPANFSLLRAAAASPSVSPTAAKELGSVMLPSLLLHPTSSMLEVVSSQTQWQYSSLTPVSTSLFSDILTVLGSTHFLELVQRALSVEQLNWPALLQAVVCFLHLEHNASELEDLVKKLVVGGVEDGDVHLLSCGLLVARQASLEGSHLFPAYGRWVQDMFGDSSSSVIRGKRELLFLLKTLTRLVPYEPVFALKAHVSHPPRCLANCLSQLNDYVSLASTRLQDLGEKVLSAGQSDFDASVEVDEAIKHFKETGCISQAVMEASIFKRPYFVGRFLPYLLSPSCTDEWDRKKLIDALVREKKILPRMLRRYERACQELKDRCTSEATQCSGVESVLSELPGMVQEANGTARLLSRLSSSLDREVNRQSLTPTRAVKVVDMILSAVCRAVAESYSSECRWVGDLVAMLGGHTGLHLPLYFRLAELLTVQFPELVGFQVLGLAVLLCQVLFVSPPMTMVEDGGRLLTTGEDYCLSLLSRLKHDEPAQFLRFSCLLMEQCCGCAAPTPACLLTKTVYVYRREKLFLSSDPTDPGWEAVHAVDVLLQENRQLSEQWNDCKVEFVEWLSWEVQASSLEGGMSQICRQRYVWDLVFGEYLPASSAEQLFCPLFKAIARSSSKCCFDFLPIMQELSRIVLEGPKASSVLLQSLQAILSEVCMNSTLACAVKLVLGFQCIGCCSHDACRVSAGTSSFPWLPEL